MALKISETQSDASKDTGATYEYHKIESVNVSGGIFNVNIHSFKDQTARDAGKVPMAESSEAIALDMDEDIGSMNLHTFLYGKLKALDRFSSAEDV